jgi:hypothetical protein
MKTLSSYQYENDKEMRVVQLDAEDRKHLEVPDCDVLGMAVRSNGRWKWMCFRPDEAVLMVKLLSEAVFESVTEYKI